METPYNENLLLSAGYGLNGLFGDSQPVPPGRRNQVELGIQQGLGRWFVADFGYFNKRTDNGYDFGVLFNTPIAFPVAWDHSRIDGFTGRLNVVEDGGDRHSRRSRGAPRGRGADVWHRTRAERDDPREDRRDVRGPRGDPRAPSQDAGVWTTRTRARKTRSIESWRQAGKTSRNWS
jgi:hypothetical protein